MKKSAFLTLLLFYSFSTVFSQYQIGLIPRVSADKTISAKINYTDVKITYGSPKVNERAIWGELIPYGKVWRAGANNATTIEISSDVVFNEKLLPKGIYSLFVVPNKDSAWSVIFNTVHKQWGSFDYDEKENILQIEVSAIENSFEEELNYEISNKGLGEGTLSLTWEKIKLNIPFNTGFLEELKSRVLERTTAAPDHLKFIPYLQASQELINISDEVELASEWIEKALTHYDKDCEWNDQYYPKIYLEGHMAWTKAKVIARQGKYKEALAIVKELKKGDDKYTFYNYMGKRDRIDEYEAEWKLK